MKSTILLDLIFNDALKQIDNKYLGDILPSEYEIFRAINIYSLDDYYKIYSRKPNSLNLSTKLLNDFDMVIADSIRIFKKDYYPKDRILYIYAYLCYYVLVNSKIDLAKLENSLIAAKGLNKREKALSYTKGYFKIDLVATEFLDLLIRDTIKYPGAEDYYKKANWHKFYLISCFKGSKSKFKALVLKLQNKMFNSNFYEEKEGLDNFLKVYPSLLNKIVKLINAYNDYLYFNKEKQFQEIMLQYQEKA